LHLKSSAHQQLFLELIDSFAKVAHSLQLETAAQAIGAAVGAIVSLEVGRAEGASVGAVVVAVLGFFVGDDDGIAD
jgi:outer membrane lipoprotein SlyB